MSTLSILIPACTEEKAIGAIVQRCLAARDHMEDGTTIREVDVIVVNDGSADRTADVGQDCTDITLISHPVNKRYGAALKTGTPKALLVCAIVLMAIAAALNFEVARQYLSTGRIDVHWSRVLFGGFLISAAVHLTAVAALLRMADIMIKRGDGSA